ncbi:hypothetical protein SISNIDRAFT_460549 [Sistotremastrum niveocremeum HHB9708]|uniref:Uncharacterized protein n=1 Tax=Sistotremastrum niveocremeum HHB9708 TaxID=1314777 RepID=A0A164NK78_9AGAM|nr:hypothetical protein SISNIDRAFT_460549 [Sistotremastrum niveocremeum HHB9708]
MLLQGAIESVAHELRREIPTMKPETMLYSLWHELPEPEKVLRSARKSVLRMPPIEYDESLNPDKGASVVDRIFEAVRLDLRLTLIRKLARKAEKMTNSINSANDTAKVRVVRRVITRLPAIEEDN